MTIVSSVAHVRSRLAAIPALPLVPHATAVETMPRLRAWLGCRPQLFVKRDDAIGVAGGGTKIRKLAYLLASPEAAEADCIVTCGGVQSNHARIAAALAARSGLECHLVLNGQPEGPSSGNLRLMQMFGARIEYVDGREDRDEAVTQRAARLRASGRRPLVVPLGGSVALGAVGVAQAVFELSEQGVVPDVVIVASSSGGTQAGLAAGFACVSPSTRVIGISADEPAAVLAERVRVIAGEVFALADQRLEGIALEVDDTFVGGGYAIPTPESSEAQAAAGRLEGLVLDPTYTAKAMAALVAYARAGLLHSAERVLFWHTGGLPSVFG